MDFFYIGLSFLLIGLNAFFVAAEFAIVKVRPTQLKELRNAGNPLAGVALGLSQQLDVYLSVCQVGITLASLGLGWIGEPAFAHLIEPSLRGLGQWAHFTSHALAIPIAFLLITILHIVLGELVPKSIALRQAPFLAIATALPMRFFYILFYPLLGILNRLSNLILFLIRFPAAKRDPDAAISEEEFRLILKDTSERGTFSPERALLIRRALDFAGHRARDIMIPKSAIVTMSMARPLEENLKIARDSGHTRFPLTRDNDLSEVLGIIHLKEVIWVLEDKLGPINLFDLVKPVLFIAEHEPIAATLRRFKAQNIHLGLVVAEKAQVTGLLTLEDILEKIVGDLPEDYSATQAR